MLDVFIIADSTVVPSVAQAMQQAIRDEPNGKGIGTTAPSRWEPATVRVVAPDELTDPAIAAQLASENAIVCPLTLALPAELQFPAQSVFDACRAIAALRQQVASWSVTVAAGELWLPIVLTAKGPLYGEAIACADAGYYQPCHLSDVQRQPLYALAQRLVRSLNATPAVYLLQFGCAEREIWFDRLIPFPDAPAIASLKGQTPDLFTCHWRCLTHQPILDLIG